MFSEVERPTSDDRAGPATWKITLATLAVVTACFGLEHGLGMYEPSETTGRRGDLCGLMALVTGLTVAAWCDRALLIRRSLHGLVAMAVTIAAVTAAIRFIYFEWVRQGFAEQMATFTRTTLTERGSDPDYVEAFTASVEASWAATSILWNTFMLYAVWGSVLAVISMGIVRVVSRLRRRRSVSPDV